MDPLVQTLFQTARTMLNKLADVVGDYGLPLLIGAYDFLWSLTVGASLACVLVAASTTQSYVAILDDLARLAVVMADAGGGVADGARLLVPSKGAASVRVGSDADGGADEPLAGSGEKKSALCGADLLTKCSGAPSVKPFAPDGTTLNLAFFSLRKAASYSALYIVNQITVFAFVALILTSAVFFFTSTLTRASAVSASVVFLVSAIYDRVVGYFYARFIARDDGTLVRPRLLSLVDFVLATTLGATSGLTSGLLRFVLGVLKLLFDMTLLSQPLVPALASLDGGFVAYGSMLQAATLSQPV
jgi:hypothetical protein